MVQLVNKPKLINPDEGEVIYDFNVLVNEILADKPVYINSQKMDSEVLRYAMVEKIIFAVNKGMVRRVRKQEEPEVKIVKNDE